MKLMLLVVALVLSGFSAFATPGENKLISPDSVRVVGNEVVVTFTIPCQYDDWSAVVMTNDDTGDQLVAVGVVVSMQERNCKGGPPKQFEARVNPRVFGYEPVAEGFVPMEVQ